MVPERDAQISIDRNQCLTQRIEESRLYGQGEPPRPYYPDSSSYRIPGPGKTSFICFRMVDFCEGLAMIPP